MLFLDGAYAFRSNRAIFHCAQRPTGDRLNRLLCTLSRRMVRVVERRGLLIVDPDHPSLDLVPDSGLDHLQAASIAYRIATGPQAGRYQALVGGSSRAGGVPVQATVPGRVDARGIGAVGFPGETRRTHSPAQTEPYSFPRGIRAQLQTPQTHRAAASQAHRCRQSARPDDLGAAPQAGVYDRRGNNRQAIFTYDADVAAYAHWLLEAAQRFEVAIHGWVFMTNHVHLLATPSCNTGLSRLMQYLGRLYVRHFNYFYTRSGTLFEGRFKTCIVQQDQYLLTCLRYIELNPVRADLIKDPGDYRWSSYRAHAFGVHAKLWSPHALYLGLGENAHQRQYAWRELIDETLDIEVLAKIRHCANTGLVLGTEGFREQVRKL